MSCIQKISFAWTERNKRTMLKKKELKCYAYFRGKDGLGNCGSECQWYVMGIFCPYNFEEEPKR